MRLCITLRTSRSKLNKSSTSFAEHVCTPLRKSRMLYFLSMRLRISILNDVSDVNNPIISTTNKNDTFELSVSGSGKAVGRMNKKLAKT